MGAFILFGIFVVYIEWSGCGSAVKLEVDLFTSERLNELYNRKLNNIYY
ncbi:hypothetical protein WG904_03405 [Pedobacter sp. Du54]